MRFLPTSAVCTAVVVAAAAGCESNETPGADSPSGTDMAVREGGTVRPETLVFGLTPYLSPEQLRVEFMPLAKHVGEVVGIPADVRVASNYADLAKLLQRDEVHIAVMSPFAYVRAKRDNPGMLLLGTHIADGSSTYSAYIVAREDSGVETVDALRGKTFGFVDRSPASGYLYPLAYLRSLGYEPDTFFSKVEFAGNHPALIQRILNKDLDAGATFSTAYKNAKSKNLRILAKTGRIPYDAYCTSARLDHDLVQQIRTTMLKVSTRTESGRQLLGGLTHINGFVTVGDDHYDEVRRVARLVEQGMRASP